MGKISAVFKADGDESANAYAISGWWLEPQSTGPGAHVHPEVLNISVPGGFEPAMPEIAKWFADNPPAVPLG
jgi:hypothetical protein